MFLSPFFDPLASIIMVSGVSISMTSAVGFHGDFTRILKSIIPLEEFSGYI